MGFTKKFNRVYVNMNLLPYPTYTSTHTYVFINIHVDAEVFENGK